MKDKQMTVQTARQKTSAKRLAIIKAAASCFAKYSFESATIRQIADEAGILVGSIYYHFATKEEMLLEVMIPFFQIAVEGTLKVARTLESPEEKLRNLVRFSLSHAMEYRAQHLILIRNQEIFLSNPAFRFGNETWSLMRREWLAVFQAGIDAKIFRSDLDPEIATQIVNRLITSCAGWFRPDGRMKPEQFVDFVCNFVLFGSAGILPGE